MALQYERVAATADAIADVANQLTSLYALVQQLLEYNSDQAIDWTAGVKPAYITEDANGNLSGRQFSRAEVANAIGSLDWLRKLMTNQSMAGSQGDHLGNLNHLARPLG